MNEVVGNQGWVIATAAVPPTTPSIEMQVFVYCSSPLLERPP